MSVQQGGFGFPSSPLFLIIMAVDSESAVLAIKSHTGYYTARRSLVSSYTRICFRQHCVHVCFNVFACEVANRSMWLGSGG